MNRPSDDALEQALADLYGQGTSFRFEQNWREAVRREEQTQMKRNQKHIWTKVVLPIAAALVLILGANWAGQMEADYAPEVMRTEERSAKSAYQYSSAPAPEGRTSGAVMMSMASSADTAANHSASYDAVSYEEAAYEATAGEAAGGANSITTLPQENRKLIRTVDISLRSENFDADLDGIQHLLTANGGYVESMHLNGEAGSPYGRNASLTLRVPSENLDAFLNGVSGYGRVTARSETTQDMTEQYTDNEARIQTLRVKLERLTSLLSQAQDVSDILEIEGEIADTQYQLERYESQQLNIDRKVDMSYVYINVQESLVQDDVEDEELTLGQRLKAALKASMEGTGRFLRNLLVFIVMVLPVLVPVAIVWLLVRLIRKKRKTAKGGEEKSAQAPRDLLSDLSDQSADDADEAE